MEVKKKEVRLIKTNSGEEFVGFTDGEIKDGYLRMEKIIHLMVLPPDSPGAPPKVAFGDYVPWAYPVGSMTNPEERKAKYFSASDLRHPPMEVQDSLEKEYRSLWSGIALPEGDKLIIPGR